MRLTLLLCALALPASAQTDLGAMTPPERAAFNAEMRAALFAFPEVIAEALAAPDYGAAANRQAAADDLDLIKELSSQVLGGADIALFTARGCAPCVTAQNELQTVTERTGTTFALHDMSRPEGAALAARFGIPDAPFYVMPDMVLRGHMPAVVLEKYLRR